MKIKKQISIANLCIDTGAKSTLLTPKGYKKIRDSLRDVEFKKLTIEGIGGGSSALVKIIPSISIITDNREIKLKNVPALLKVAPFPHCDVVLGMDALFNTLHSIDFKNSLITLIAERH